MKYYGVTTTYNNEKTLPFIMKYYEDWGYDKLIVYDNESTDNTVELLKRYPFVEVRTFGRDYNTDKTFSKTAQEEDKIYFETKKLQVLREGLFDLYEEHVKETCGYVEGKTELAWVTITDFDEVPYFYGAYDRDFQKKQFFEVISSHGYNIINEDMLHLLSTDFPKDKDKFIHEQVEMCSYGGAYMWKKPILFRLDNLYTVWFTYGEHTANFRFFGQKPKPLSNTRYFHIFHLKYAFGDNLFRNWYGNDFNIKDKLSCAIPIKSYFEHKMLNGVTPNEDSFCVSEYEENKKDLATSPSNFKEDIKRWIQKRFSESSTILDVGAGRGTYKNLLGEMFSNMDAVEIFYPNIINYHLFEKYRNVFKCNIVNFEYSNYELIIFGDVLEHLAVEDAQRVLEYAFNKCKNFIVALPYCDIQDEYGGNKHEKHIQDDLTPEIVLKRYPMLKELYRDEFCGYYIKNEEYKTFA